MTVSEAIPDPTGIEIPQGRMFLQDRQIREARDEITSIKRTLADPAAKIEDRAGMSRRLRTIQNDLDSQSAPETTPEQRDKLSKEEKRLRGEISDAMLSTEEMRKCPPGALGRNVRFETEFKSRILRWKNIVRALNPGNDDPDVSNLERFRPKTNSLNMDNALIPGKQFFLSPDTQEYKDNYERTFSTETDTNRRIAELEAKLAALTAEKPKSAKKQASQELVSALCGRLCQGNFGKSAHERRCKHCAELASQLGGSTAA